MRYGVKVLVSNPRSGKKSGSENNLAAVSYNVISKLMNNINTEMKGGLLSTQYSKTRRVFSGTLLLILSAATVLTFWYMYFTYPGVDCWRGFFYISVPWLVVQIVVIAYLYFFNNIPAFARGAIDLLIGMANLWFILFLFSLKACPG